MDAGAATDRLQAADGERTRRHELGAFLRSRRERTSPEQVGLPVSARRRTPGLRREELAILAGVSATWYAVLEQGRDVRPSAEVLAAIAGALRLDEREREQLRRLAEEPLRAAPDAASSVVAAETIAVLDLVRPAPAFVASRAEDLLAWNPPMADLLPGLLAGGTERPNLARWALLDPAARAVLVEWDHVARTVVGRVRTTLGRHPGDPDLRRLADDLLSGSAAARGWWQRYDVAAARSGMKRIRHPDRGVLRFGYAAFAVDDGSEQTLVVFTPEPDAPG